MLCEDLPIQAGDRVLFGRDKRGGSALDATVSGRGGKDPRSGALMRSLGGVLEMSRGWNFDSTHVPGVFNDVADGISRGEQIRDPR